MVQSAFKDMSIVAARRLRWNGIIEAVVADIATAGSRVAWKLMDRNKCRVWFVQQNGFGAIAVVNIKIIYGDALGTGCQGFEGGNRDVAQVTKTIPRFGG